MDKNQYHVLVLTAENALIYIKYDHPVTHLEVYNHFHKDKVEVKDCYIQENKSWNLAEMLIKAINKWVVKHFEEDVSPNSIIVKSYIHEQQYIILELNGFTTSGKPFSVRPSELISPKINYFSEFC